MGYMGGYSVSNKITTFTLELFLRKPDTNLCLSQHACVSSFIEICSCR